ncbi:MAG TPA: cell division protein FtsA [Dehalococcoidia bacterium]|nr:cell division protein FtsA [Dehalococcoidia bacterium]
MAKESTFSAIDVGTSKICTLIASFQEGSLKILGAGITPSEGIRKGLVVNIDQAREAIKRSVHLAQRTSGRSVNAAYISVTGRHISSVNNRGVVAIPKSDRMVSSRDLKRVLQSARSITIPNERRLLHVIPRSYTLDGQTGVRNPVGMCGFRLDVETHIITAAATSIHNLVKCIRGVGVEVENLVLEPLASAEAVIRPEEKEAGVLLVDIGGGTTDIAIFKEGSIWHTSVLPVGGYQITRDISIGLGIPWEMAEGIKKRYGSLLVKSSNSDQQAEPTPLAPGNSYAGLSQDLGDIIRARVDEIFKLVMLEMPDSKYETIVPAGMVLTGGTANLPGIDALAQEVLNLPVRIGAPQGMVGLADDLHDPAYASSVGLLLWAAHQQSDEPALPYQPRLGRRGLARRWFSRLKSWLGR